MRSAPQAVAEADRPRTGLQDKPKFMSLRHKIGVILGGVTLLIIGINSATLAYEENEVPMEYVDEEWVELQEEEKVVLVEVHPTILNKIAACESGTRNADGTAIEGSQRQHTKDQDVVIGQHTDPRFGLDLGILQINTKYHGERAAALGYNLWDEADNWAYGRLLYREQGTAPWGASKDCWSRM